MNGIEDRIMQVKGTYPIRFADDIAVFSDTQDKLEKTKEHIEVFLKPRGLTLNEEKTSITSIEDGIDFLGYNIREYPNATKVGLKGKPTKKGILLVKPGKKAITNFKDKIRKTMQSTKSRKAFDVIKNLNPIIRGWSNYFNAGGGWTETKNKLGYWIWTILKKWVYVKHRGSTVGKRTLLSKYFKGIQRRQTYWNNWTFFGMRGNQEILIHDIQEVKVVRENELPFSPSPNPYNPEDYAKVDSRLKRQIKNDERLHKLKLNLVRKQDGICLICGQVIILDLEKVERDHIIPKAEGGEDTFKNSMVIHKECHQKKTAWERKWRAYLKKKAKSNTSGQ